MVPDGPVPLQTALGGGQVAVLRLYAATSLPRNDCRLFLETGVAYPLNELSLVWLGRC